MKNYLSGSLSKLALLIFSGIIIVPLFTCSQTRTIKGTVTDTSHNPMVGASVMIKNSSHGTTTNASGEFYLTVKDSVAILIIQYPGFKTYEFTSKKNLEPVQVVMEVESVPLNEEIVKAPLIKADHLVGLPSNSDTYYSFDEGITLKETSAGFISPHAESGSGSARYTNSLGKSGILTAGEINDFSKWILWKDIEAGDLHEWKDYWMIQPDKRYSLQVETESGMPVVDAAVQLTNARGEIFWSAKTDNTGKAELWTNIFRNVSFDDLIIKVTMNGKNYSLNNIKEFHDGINIIKIPAPCGAPAGVDIAFVVDATGSMQDEIDYLKAEMNNIIGRIKDSLTDKDLNLGCVFYRDHGDAYLTKKSDLSPDIQKTVSFIKENNADGGGDFPEAVDDALNEAINHLSWRGNATARIIFLILDAPPHGDSAIKIQLKRLITQAAVKGIRIVPVTCSGIEKSTEYLLRSVALATNGTYVFLTDHSGIGNHHIEPTTDKYDVELLNNVLFRVIYNFSHTVACDPPVFVAMNDTLTVLNPSFMNQIPDSAAEVFPEDSVSNNKQDSTEAEPKFIRWKYYPNPTYGIVHVEIAGEIKELFVADLAGKIILRYEVGKNHLLEIDLSDFAAGTYLLMAEYATDKRVSGKVVLVH